MKGFSEKKNDLELTDRIIFNGSFIDAADYIARLGLMSREAAVESLHFLMENPSLLEPEQEMITAGEVDDSICEGYAGFIVEEACFYINVTKSKLMLGLSLVSTGALLLAGVKPTEAVCAIVVTSMPILAGAKFGFQFYEETGEKCVMYVLASEHKPITPKDIRKRLGKVCTRGYDCNFKEKGKCRCKVDEIKKICNIFESRGAVESRGDSYVYIR